jgi:hypothetical protein
MDEHLRVELLDPRWREHDERRRAELQEMKKTYASGFFIFFEFFITTKFTFL